MRVCADFSTGLNATLKNCHYPLPSLEDIFAKLNSRKFFSKTDFSDAYLQILFQRGEFEAIVYKYTPRIM